MEEILSWLPVKSLFRLRCVQKSWSTLFRNPTLIAKHLLHHQTKTESPTLLVMSSDSMRYGFTLHPYPDDDNSVRILDGSKDLGLAEPRLPGDVNLFGCINGIICIGGSFNYWLGFFDNGRINELWQNCDREIILSFDMSHEVFRIMRLPDEVF